MKIEELIGHGVTPFFEITVPPPKAKNQNVQPSVPLISNADIQGKIFSLKVTDKEGSPSMVDLTLLDDSGRINKKYSYGFQVQIEWGLKQSGNNVISSFLDSIKNKNVIKGTRKRGPMLCHFLNYAPSGADGIVQSTISMRAGVVGGYNQVRKTYYKETPNQIIHDIATKFNLGGGKYKAFVDFDEMDIPLTKKTAITQGYESNWAFLRKLSYQFQCKLFMQSDPAIIYFIGWPKQYDVKSPLNRNLTGLYHQLDYGTVNGGLANDLSVDLFIRSLIDGVSEFLSISNCASLFALPSIPFRLIIGMVNASLLLPCRLG